MASRARRVDAEANLARILAAALELLGRGEDPSMAEVAAASGVSRQTVYSHFPNRQTLLAAAGAHLVTEVAAGLGAPDLPEDPVVGLVAWLERAWRLLDHIPALLNPASFAGLEPTDPVTAHEPVLRDLRPLLARAADRGVLARGASPEWLAAGVIALAHAAAQEVTAGRMGSAEAGDAFRSGALRLCLRPEQCR